MSSNAQHRGATLGLQMLIGSFSNLLHKCRSTGSYGCDELDDHFGELVGKLRYITTSQGRRDYLAVLSFMVNQVTQWDSIIIVDKDLSSINVALKRGRSLSSLSKSTIKDSVLVGKPPISQRIINLEATFVSEELLPTLRAPGICFLIADNPELLHHYSDALSASRNMGQAYAVLALIDPSVIERWLDFFTRAFGAFHTCFWHDIEQEKPNSNSVLTVVTADVPAYAI